LMFASEWFSTLFCYGMQLETTIRVWDLLIIHNSPKMLLCAALAMLQCTQAQLLKLSFDDMLPYSKSMARAVKDTDLAAAMAAITIDEQLYQRLAAEYQDPANRSYFDSHFQ